MHQSMTFVGMLGRRYGLVGTGVILLWLTGCAMTGDVAETRYDNGESGGNQGGAGVGGASGHGGGVTTGAGGMGNGGTAGAGNVNVPRGTSVFIQVQDPEGRPISQAQVVQYFPDRPFESVVTATTDASGSVLYEDLRIDDFRNRRFVGRVHAEGHADAMAVVELQDGLHLGKRVVLYPLGDAQRIEDVGVESTIERGGVHVTIPANALVDADGQPVTGDATVTIIPFDPTIENAQNLPAPLEGAAQPNEPPVPLASVMMAEISVWKNGAQLQLAPGKWATMTFDIPAALQNAYEPGAKIPAWSLDMVSGLWQRDGEGVVLPSPVNTEKYVWTTEIHHFSWHNADYPYYREQYCFYVTVTNFNHQPLADVLVESEGFAGGFSNDSGVTDSEGRTCISVKMNTSATISVLQSWNRAPLASSVTVHAGGDFRTCQGGLGQETCEEVPVILAQQPSNPVCIPGSTVDCTADYPDPMRLVNPPCQAGWKWCKADGSGFEPQCVGVVTPRPDDCNTYIDENCDGAINDGCTLLCDYHSDATNPWLPCYTGPSGTEGIGVCHGGRKYCMPGGAAWGPCMDEMTPYYNELCYSAGAGVAIGDYDCDGRSNRTECICWIGEIDYVYPPISGVTAINYPDGRQGSSPTSQCIAGLSHCEQTSLPSPFPPSSWQVPVDWTAPSIEVCDNSNVIDEDCDGAVNEDGQFCCTPSPNPGSRASGCTLENACQSFECSVGHECRYSLRAMPLDTPGDCQSVSCAIQTTQPVTLYREVFTSNAADSNDQNECTADSCLPVGPMMCTPQHINAPIRTPCMNPNGLCDANGECVACLVQGDCDPLTEGDHCYMQRCFSCNDNLNVPNGDETDVNCGGQYCLPCADNKMCLQGSDCESHVCGINWRCAAPTCTDCCKNGDETGVNCGGTTCSKCGNGASCVSSSDCVSNICTNGICMPVSPCNNDMHYDPSRGETDVDCGGAGCPMCTSGKHCVANSDCTQNVCLDHGTLSDTTDDYCQ